jgi:hypothetical protein
VSWKPRRPRHSAAEAEGGAILHRARNLIFDPPRRFVRNQRTDVRVARRGVADFEQRDKFKHPLRKLRGDRPLHIDALARGAILTGIEQPRSSNARDGDIEIGILENDERIHRAEFEIDLLELGAGGSRDFASDCV